MSCATCKHLFEVPRDAANLKAPRNIVCRRYPPSILMGPMGPVSLFPSIIPHFHCGEHQEKIMGMTSPVNPENSKG